MMFSGSVGAAWPPKHDRQNNRIKGFAGIPIRTESELRVVRDSVRAAEGSFASAERTTVRALVERSLRRNMNGSAPGRMEAHFSADRAAPGFDIVYFGSNRNGRAARLHEAEAESHALRQVVSTIEPTTREDAFSRVSSAGYRIEQIDSLPRDLLSQLVTLYNQTYQEYTFKLDESHVRGMAREGNIMLGAFNVYGQVVGAMVAEKATVRVGNDHLVLYELSDYATSHAHRGAGLMTAMQLAATDMVRSGEHGNEALIYIESRAPWTPVNISIHKTGQFQYCGTLPQHCKIVSDRDLLSQGNFENLHVWAEGRMD